MAELYYRLIVIPAAAFILCVYGIKTGSYSFWQWYVIIFPFLFVILPFVLKKYFKKVNILLIALLVFLILQTIPLPRSPYHTIGGELSPSPRNEPFAIGMGFPFSLVKLFLGNGCLTQSSSTCSGTSYTMSQSYARLTPSQQKTGEAPGIIHPGDIVFLPDSWKGLVGLGFLIDGYILFLITLGIKRLIVTPSIKLTSKS